MQLDVEGSPPAFVRDFSMDMVPFLEAKYSTVIFNKVIEIQAVPYLHDFLSGDFFF